MFAGSRSEASAFRSIASRFVVVLIEERGAIPSAVIRAGLMRLGRAKSRVDVLIAGVASAGSHALVRRDVISRPFAVRSAS